jgi:hypothetical protein
MLSPTPFTPHTAAAAAASATSASASTPPSTSLSLSTTSSATTNQNKGVDGGVSIVTSANEKDKKHAKAQNSKRDDSKFDEKATPLTLALKAHYKTKGKVENLFSKHRQEIADINLSIIETRREKIPVHEFHVMSDIDFSRKQLSGECYIFVKREPLLKSGVFRITMEGRQHPIPINDFKKFEQTRLEMMGKEQVKYITNDQFHRLITSNGGYILQNEKKDTSVKDKGSTKKADRPRALKFFEVEYNVTESIKPPNIFTHRPGDTNEPRRIIILGRAGIGKTTMSQYFAFQWAMNQLWTPQFAYVFWIPLRNLGRSYYQKESELTLAKIIYRECISTANLKDGKDALDPSPITLEHIQHVLDDKEEQKNTLLLLDGFDEVAHLVSKEEETPVSHVLNEALNFPHLVLTTRPYRIQNIITSNNLPPFDRQLENMGFTNANIEDYVTRYFNTLTPSDEKNGQALITFLRANPNVWGSAHIPINLTLLCHVWQKETKQQEGKSEVFTSTQMNITRLYRIICRHLIKRYLKERQNTDTQNWSEEELYKACKSEVTCLERLAFSGIQTGYVNLSLDIQEKAVATVRNEMEKENAQGTPLSHLFNRVLELGFLRTVGEDTEEEIEREHYFVHLTFQEFFAARFLAHCLQNNNARDCQQAMSFISENKYNPRYQIVLIFTAGLLGADNTSEPSSAFIRFWNTLLAPPLDLCGIGHIRLVTLCLEETHPEQLISHRLKLLQEIQAWIMSGVYGKVHLKWLIKILQNSPQVLRQLQEQTQIIRDILTALGNKDIEDFSRDEMKTVYLGQMFWTTHSFGQVPTGRRIGGVIDHSLNTRCNAAYLLGELNIRTAPVLSALQNTLEGDREVRRYAAEALHQLGETSYEINNAIQNSSHWHKAQVSAAVDLKNEAIHEMEAHNLLTSLDENTTNRNIIRKLNQFSFETHDLTPLNRRISTLITMGCYLSNTSWEVVMQAYFTTQRSSWAIFIAKRALLNKGTAITINGNGIMIHGRQDSVISWPETKKVILARSLIQAFEQEAKALRLPDAIAQAYLRADTSAYPPMSLSKDLEKEVTIINNNYSFSFFKIENNVDITNSFLKDVTISNVACRLM